MAMLLSQCFSRRHRAEEAKKCSAQPNTRRVLHCFLHSKLFCIHSLCSCKIWVGNTEKHLSRLENGVWMPRRRGGGEVVGIANCTLSISSHRPATVASRYNRCTAHSFIKILLFFLSFFFIFVDIFVVSRWHTLPRSPSAAHHYGNVKSI